MPKPTVDNELVKTAFQVWSVSNYTFVVISNGVNETGFSVRVFPHDDRESFWLDNGSWETESGTAWSILNYLNDQADFDAHSDIG